MCLVKTDMMAGVALNYINLHYPKKADHVTKLIPQGTYHCEFKGPELVVVVICIFSRSVLCFSIC